MPEPRAAPANQVHTRERDIFAGIREDDVEDQLDNYDSVGKHSRWDDNSKFNHAVFYLFTDEELPDLASFTIQLKQMFRTARNHQGSR